jgi:uncharacterized C2H2 Zn-finger protein
VKGFTCEHCKLMFRHKNSLIRHMFLHTGERPYRCQRCNKAFTGRDRLSKHVKESHPEEFAIQSIQRERTEIAAKPTQKKKQQQQQQPVLQHPQLIQQLPQMLQQQHPLQYPLTNAPTLQAFTGIDFNGQSQTYYMLDQSNIYPQASQMMTLMPQTTVTTAPVEQQPQFVLPEGCTFVTTPSPLTSPPLVSVTPLPQIEVIVVDSDDDDDNEEDEPKKMEQQKSPLEIAMMEITGETAIEVTEIATADAAAAGIVIKLEKEPSFQVSISAAELEPAAAEAPAQEEKEDEKEENNSETEVLETDKSDKVEEEKLKEKTKTVDKSEDHHLKTFSQKETKEQTPPPQPEQTPQPKQQAPPAAASVQQESQELRCERCGKKFAYFLKKIYEVHQREGRCHLRSLASRS